MIHLWRHKKRGTLHELIADNVVLQCSTASEFEDRFKDEGWTIYRSLDNGTICMRPTKEFLDGRFEPFDDGIAMRERINLPGDWSLRKLPLPDRSEWALQYHGMDWIRISEFLPLKPSGDSLDLDMQKFSAAMCEQTNK
jgi:hypothetical protein